ncbi:MAG: type II secretion system protein [Nitrospirae bacterium]|nr:type II secretion system protein [Nitrospirota bacterium]
MPLKGIRGFSLIELMVVISIISLLTAIAVPAYLGQREKSKVRATESNAKSAATDLQGYLDSYVSGDPYMVTTDSTGTQGCVESASASAVKSCLTVFNQASVTTYPAFPNGLTTVISHFASTHTFNGDKSAFKKLPLFVTSHTADGWGQVL